jgi:hypothetical protein
MRRIAILATAAFLLCGCTTLQGLIGPTASQDALQAARITITTYADIYQPAVIAYGHLPVCGAPEATMLCKNPVIFAQLKAADLAVATSLKAAQAVLEGTLSDSGQITSAISAIQQAEASIAASGALVKS